MSIEVTVGRQRVPDGSHSKYIESGLRDASLDSLFHAVAKHHPDLAPLLEDATHADDLEIFINNRRLNPDSAPEARLHDGDSVALFLKGSFTSS